MKRNETPSPLKYFVPIMSLVLLGMMSAAQGLTLVYDQEISGSGATIPTGYVTAELAIISGNQIQLTVTNNLDTVTPGSSEYLAGLYFNLDPLLDLGDISVTQDSGTAVSGISLGVNAYKADGDGFFDLWIEWPAAGAPRFTSGQAVFTIENRAAGGSLDISSFEYLSTGSDTGTGYLSIARVRSIGPDGSGSGWFAPTPVPEPASMTLLGLGLAGMAVRRFRKR